MKNRRSILLSIVCVAVLALLVFVVRFLGMRTFSTADYVATVRSAKTTLPIAVEIEQLFPDKTDHFITDYGKDRFSGVGIGQWNSEAEAILAGPGDAEIGVWAE